MAPGMRFHDGCVEEMGQARVGAVKGRVEYSVPILPLIPCNFPQGLNEGGRPSFGVEVLLVEKAASVQLLGCAPVVRDKTPGAVFPANSLLGKHGPSKELVCAPNRGKHTGVPGAKAGDDGRNELGVSVGSSERAGEALEAA